MWAHQQFTPNHCNCNCVEDNTRPDIISFGKKTQVCGIFASKRLDEVEGHVFKESSRLNSTWGGSLVDMVRFTVYLEIMEKDNLVENAAKNGEYLKEQLNALQMKHSGLVSNTRNLGLFGAFDMRDSKERDETIGLIAEEGAMMLGCGLKTIRFRPHLNITKSEIDQGFSMIDKAIRKI